MYIVGRFLRDNSATFKGIGLGYDNSSQTGIIYSDTASGASNIAFWTYSGSSYGERMRITSGGNVGIGTSSPDLTLSINGAMNLRNSTRAGAFEIDSSGNLWMGSATTAGNIYFETGHSTTGLPSTGTPRMTITGSGNVGIGTSSPSGGGGASDRTLSVNSGAGAASFITSMVGGTRYSTLFTSSNNFVLETNANIPLSINTNGVERVRVTTEGAGTLLIGTTSSQGAIVVDSNRANLVLGAATSSKISFNNGSTTTTGYIYNSGTETSIAYAGTFNFQTIAGSNLVTLTSGGNVLIGTTTDNGYKLTVSGQSIFTNTASSVVAQRTGSDGQIMTFYKDGTLVGSISTNANSLPSDLNFKKNINNLELGLNLVTKLRSVSYNHKIDDDNTALSTGFIAQELEQSLTELGVKENEYHILQHKPNVDAKQSQYWLDYTKMIPILVKAIQEQQAQIEELKELIKNK
jgi:hypothetical protein